MRLAAIVADGVAPQDDHEESGPQKLVARRLQSSNRHAQALRTKTATRPALAAARSEPA